MIRSSLVLLLAAITPVGGFYLPGVNPQSFGDGDPVKLKVNKMTSHQTLMPVDYYRLPFCQPVDGVNVDNENLGEFLAGDRIKSSPYRLNMKEEMYCEQLCSTNLGRGEQRGVSPNKVVRAIRKEYHNNWIVDNLSAASKVEDDTTITTRYWQGFPVGFVATDTKKAYVHNHVNIEIMYHPVETETDKYRVVRFTVEPFSIKHDFEPLEDDDNLNGDDDGADTSNYQVAKINNPIASCDPSRGSKVHTDYAMITAPDREAQIASGPALFTYDVTWKENDELHWASRWDIYLSMDNAIPAKVHWLSIANSLVIVFVLSAMIAAILVRNLRRDFARYNKLATDEEKAEDLEEFGWKLVHADVFRPPSFSPLLLSVACGTGAQILCMSFLTIIFSAMGFLSPANRGALLMAELLLYVMMGGVAGYVTARLYKTFKGKAWQRATTCTALGFPGIAFLMFFTLDVLAISQKSTDAVPFTTMIVLLVLWFGISTPLVFFGAYFGYKQDAIEFPVNTSSIPRQIPDQPWFMGIPFTLAIGGILPFGACFVELYFILASVWMDQYYYVFGFLLLVYFILIVTCAEITVLFCYFQLCGENYHWWWRSFCTAGSTALYVFLYSFVYFKQLEANSLATYLLYFGYMGLVSLGLLCMTGFIGVASSLAFNKTIFSSIKID
uniref:Transmembrane 9 superfamily member n=1 Tax=Grammatophora oceanica TaxID=210454 RepID=A0A7S1VVU3_9STRA|eukprot:CAMPEP_0194028152 /NCGR_PEP_ID=MMETSP0009_2-20130614/2168_1 /TAXON_ID=210454 /ORGANISM="Grammatophora oceanica, Strain CCMP 410" /LENGTH=667 /DNA_ID=CAMNT_0038667439 /DNA_START=81 /DNA_END=2084 /DNA_ORIENTATION=-